MATLKTKARIILSSLLGKSFTSISIPNTPIISFDVFDTLIIRPGISIPSDVFDMLNPEDKNFKTRRIEAEKRARAESGEEDITLEEIYKVLMPTAPDEELKQAMEREIEAELKVCRANPDALDFFNQVRESGKCIIIISDMYLNSHTIRTILTHCGYDISSVPVYVSSEYAKTKRTGSLFKTVLSLESVESGEVLHIGDNLRSDVIRPKLVAPQDIIHIGDNLRSDWFRPKLMGMKAILIRTRH